jgi:hypothetical protein
VALIAKLNVRKTTLGSSLFDSRSRDFHTVDDRLDETHSVLEAVTVEKKSESSDLINFGIASVVYLAFWWTEWYPLPREKSNLFLDRSRTSALPVDHSKKMITSKDSVIRREVMMTNDLSSRECSWSVLPMNNLGRNEVRDRAMVVGNGLSNLDQQLVAPE